MPSPVPATAAWAEQAERIRSMADVVAAFLAQRMDRAAVLAWTEEFHRASGGGQVVFPAHAVGETVFQSLCGIGTKLEDGYVVREEDVRSYARWLAEGDDGDPSIYVADLSAGPQELLGRVGGQTTRFWVAGLGWHWSSGFASPASGTRFAAAGPLIEAQPWQREPSAWLLVPSGADVDQSARDLFETLALDEAIIERLHPSVRASGWSRWAVVRQDDNGRRFDASVRLVRERARRELAHFESLGHKQTYWLEERPPAPFERPPAGWLKLDGTVGSR